MILKKVSQDLKVISTHMPRQKKPELQKSLVRILPGTFKHSKMTIMVETDWWTIRKLSETINENPDNVGTLKRDRGIHGKFNS